MSKLLFLDFDGVLHPNFSQERDYFCRIDLLMDALGSEISGLEVIISSSWRFHHSFDQIVGYLPQALQRIVSGATPEVEPGHLQRYREICAYLLQYNRVPDWRALDDDVNEFPKDCKKLVSCNGRVGLDEGSANQLNDWLKKAG